MNPASFSVPTIAAIATAAINPAVPTNGARDEAREVNPPAAALAAFPSTDVRLPERAATASDPIIFFPIAPISNFYQTANPCYIRNLYSKKCFSEKSCYFTGCATLFQPIKQTSNRCFDCFNDLPQMFSPNQSDLRMFLFLSLLLPNLFFEPVQPKKYINCSGIFPVSVHCLSNQILIQSIDSSRNIINHLFPVEIDSKIVKSCKRTVKSSSKCISYL